MFKKIVQENGNITTKFINNTIFFSWRFNGKLFKIIEYFYRKMLGKFFYKKSVSDNCRKFSGIEKSINKFTFLFIEHQNLENNF